MTSLLMPKLETGVSIALTGKGNALLQGKIFLEACSPFRNGPETIDDFLNRRKEPFFPFLDQQNGLFFQINRKCIDYLLEPLPTREQMIGPPAMIFLSNGELHNVSMIADLPSEHSRLQDYLNLGIQFLVFLLNDFFVYFNKDCIAKVTEHE